MAKTPVVPEAPTTLPDTTGGMPKFDRMPDLVDRKPMEGDLLSEEERKRLKEFVDSLSGGTLRF
jgi:hypothetical protein